MLLVVELYVLIILQVHINTIISFVLLVNGRED